MGQAVIDLDEALDRARAELRARGVLLNADGALPSLTVLMTDGRVTGSWWAHPLAHEIYLVGRRLAADPDVLVAKLIDGKLTYIHRSLWPCVVSAATSREPWQFDGLTGAARSMLEDVERAGAVTPAPALDPTGRKRRRETLAMLESRLLAVSFEEHTASGRHAKRLESWVHWASRVGFRPTDLPAAEARREIERVVGALAAGGQASVRLPWGRLTPPPAARG